MIDRVSFIAGKKDRFTGNRSGGCRERKMIEREKERERATKNRVICTCKKTEKWWTETEREEERNVRQI